MSSPVWNSASRIDDTVAELRSLVDQAELSPCPDTFREIRLLLNSVEAEAGGIMAEEHAKTSLEERLEYLRFSKFREPAAASTSRQSIASSFER